MPGGRVIKNSQILKSRRSVLCAPSSTGLLIAVVIVLAALTAAAPKKVAAAPSRSTSIALTSDETRVVVCDLDYLPSYGKTHVYFGVTVTQKANQAVTASLTSAGIPGYDHPKATVQVTGSTIFLAGD